MAITQAGKVTSNRVPLPNSLFTSIKHPMLTASDRAMGSPSPAPSNRRFVDPSAWLNGSKIVVSCTGAMPIPVSETIRLPGAAHPFGRAIVTVA